MVPGSDLKVHIASSTIRIQGEMEDPKYNPLSIWLDSIYISNTIKYKVNL